MNSKIEHPATFDISDFELNPSKGKCKEGYVNTYDISTQQPACGKFLGMTSGSIDEKISFNWNLETRILIFWTLT